MIRLFARTIQWISDVWDAFLSIVLRRAWQLLVLSLGVIDLFRSIGTLLATSSEIAAYSVALGPIPPLWYAMAGIVISLAYLRSAIWGMSRHAATLSFILFVHWGWITYVTLLSIPGIAQMVATYAAISFGHGLAVVSIGERLWPNS